MSRSDLLKHYKKNLIRLIKKIVTLTNYNRKTFLGFEILFKLVSVMVAIPIILGGTELTLKMTGYEYLTLHNVGRFFRHPVVITEGLIILLLVAFYEMMEASAIIYTIDRSYQKKKVTIFQTIRFSFLNAKRIFARKNILFIIWISVLLPFLCVGEYAILATMITIPSIVMTIIRNNMLIIRIGIAVLIIAAFVLARGIYAFHYFTLELKDFRNAIRSSKRLSKGNRAKDVVTIAGVQLLLYLASFILSAFGIVMVLSVAKIFSELHLLNYVYTSAVWGLLLVMIILVIAVAFPISFMSITILYYLRKESKEERIIHGSLIIEKAHPKNQRLIHTVELMILIPSVCVVTYLIYYTSTQKVNPQVEYLRTTEITAHRGASAFCPENTMAAFEKAVEFHADWIELDVQQSKDGQIFVMHDKNFKRTTGVDALSWELDYSEIARLDAGSFFSDAFEGEKIPLLSDVIAFAKENDVRLNIEIKPSIMDTDLEKHVVDLIQEMDFMDKCVVTSQSYNSLEKVKEYCEEITTVYVMSLAYGKIHRLQAADAFSVEAASITPTLVSRIHNQGKQVYAWTVNSKRKINRMIDLNVDNVITDRVALAEECIYDSKTSSVIKRYVDFLRGR